jgi:hypothetical protein
MPFPYTFPLVWRADGTEGGPTPVRGWVPRVREGRLMEAVKFRNYGGNGVPAYIVSFGPEFVEISPCEAPGITGWDLGNGIYVGMWDGMLLTTTVIIADALSPPESGLDYLELLYLYTPVTPYENLWVMQATAGGSVWVNQSLAVSGIWTPDSAAA